MNNPNGYQEGFIRDGSGPEGQRFGKCVVTGRAFKRNGIVRKERQTKGQDEILADIAEMTRKASATIGRKTMESLAGFAVFIAAFSRFKGCLLYTSPSPRDRS